MAQENKDRTDVFKINISFDIQQTRNNFLVDAYKQSQRLGYHIEKNPEKILELYHNNSRNIEEYDEKGDLVYYKHQPEFTNLSPFEIFKSFLFSFWEFVYYLLVPQDCYDKIEIAKFELEQIENRCLLSIKYKIKAKNIHDSDMLLQKIVSFATSQEDNVLSFFSIFSCQNKELIFDYLNHIKDLSETKGEDTENFLNMFRYLFYCDSDLIHSKVQDKKSTPCLTIDMEPKKYDLSDVRHYFYPLKISNMEFVDFVKMSFKKKSKKKSKLLKKKSSKGKLKKKSRKSKAKLKRKSSKKKSKSLKKKSGKKRN